MGAVLVDIGARKPDPAIFRAALDRLRMPATDVWFGAATPPPAPSPSCTVARDWPAFLDLWKAARPRGVS